VPTAKLHPFPPRNKLGKSWLEIAAVFAARAERERALGWEQLGAGDEHQFHRHMLKAETLDEAAAFARKQEGA
jgi:hypothetical protein